MLRILIIEDEIQILELLKLELSHEGYEVDTSTNGKEGLEKIEKGNYDLILLDIMLPQLNGIEVCRRARKSGLFRAAAWPRRPIPKSDARAQPLSIRADPSDGWIPWERPPESEPPAISRPYPGISPAN